MAESVASGPGILIDVWWYGDDEVVVVNGIVWLSSIGVVAPVPRNVKGGWGRKESMALDVPLPRTVPSKLGEGGGGRGLIL